MLNDPATYAITETNQQPIVSIAVSGIDRPPTYPRQYLPPGELIVCSEPCVVLTIVGSCVAVCLVDRVASVGGMNHYLLPYQVRHDHCLRYGAVAIPRLIAGLIAVGGRVDRLEAKVFGGAKVFGTPVQRRDHIGSKNVHLAFQLLSEQGIPVTAEDVDGDRGRKVFFHSDDGTAWVRKL